MPRFRKRLKNNAIYLGVSAVSAFFNAVPREVAVFIGSLFGFLGYLLYSKDRYRADRHLRFAFGDKLSPMERNKIIRRMFINFGANFSDAVRIKKYFHSELRPVIDVEGIEYFEEVYNRGRGVIGVTGHIGNFELLAAYFAGVGYKAAAIGRELYDKRLNALLVTNRESLGLVNIDTKDSPRRILECLKSGYVLGVLIDTDSFRVRGKMIPSFGRLSNTPVGQSIIGLRSGAGFVPVVCVRNGRKYKVIVKPEVTIERSDDFETDVYNITKKCTEALEGIINEYKDQWIWMHNRWRTRIKKEDLTQ